MPETSRTRPVPADLLAWRTAIGMTRPDADAVGRDLLARWTEPQRQYHTLEHLANVLVIVDACAVWAADASAVRLAAWWHDAVYDPRAPAGANEESSANLATPVLTRLGLATATVEEVARLVRLTAGHDPAPGDRNGELLCDADLGILAAEPATYAAYAQAVRREYAHVPDDLFRAGRAAVLRHLRDLPVLYRVPDLHRAWEAAARRNLAAELAALET